MTISRDAYVSALHRAVVTGTISNEKATAALLKFDLRSRGTPAPENPTPEHTATLTTCYPIDLFTKLDSVVVNQISAKKALSIAIAAYLTAANKGEDINAPRIALMGPTGSGKTHLLRSLAASTDLTFLFVNCAEYSGSGWAGKNILNIFESSGKVTDLAQTPKFLELLITKTREMFYQNETLSTVQLYKDAAKKIVIVFDEFDKIARRPGEHNQDSSRDLMSDFMSIFEGRDIELNDTHNDLKISINTKHIPIICLGAFVGLEEFEAMKPLEGMGFRAKENTNEHRLLKTDLHSYGFMPELLGRLTTFIKLQKLTKADLIKILDLNVLTPFVKTFRMYDIAVKFSDTFKEEIAEQATKSEEGARALPELVEEQIRDHLFNADNYKYSCITFEHVGSERAEVTCDHEVQLRSLGR